MSSKARPSHPHLQDLSTNDHRKKHSEHVRGDDSLASAWTRHRYTKVLLAHKKLVAKYVLRASAALSARAAAHDESKFSPVEFDPYAMTLRRFEQADYGTPEYLACCAAIAPAIQHHFAHNRHHPEHERALKEEWRPIASYEGHYEVSNFGDVRSLDRVVERVGSQGDLHKPGQIRKPHVTPKGYLRIQLVCDGVAHNYQVHRLVAEAFLPNPNGLPEVNHKNGDKRDNRAENLEWITSSQNQQHAYETGLRQPALKYVVHCVELDITTFGCEKMAQALRERGYHGAASGGVWRCINEDGAKHLDLSFESYNLVEYQGPNELSAMTLVDVLEMVCDWVAAAQRSSPAGPVRLDLNKARFGVDDQLHQIIGNTVDWLLAGGDENAPSAVAERASDVAVGVVR